MSEFMIHRKILGKYGGYLEHSVESRTSEQYSAQDSINILQELSARTHISSSRVNLATRFDTPWKDSVEINPKKNFNNIKYKSSNTIMKCHIWKSTTNLASTCPKRGKINVIDIHKEPDVEKDDVNEENSDDKLSIVSES
ncbi:hypothetical protein O181_034563 [Austropuccinia psidii MF-1]|uniref:Uncharacterized protein n=1 Tax=Austropuccinia psidii MF-1 TaxID=1389203 RepID=A0A9Q3D5Q9_9BASI|nr:hypothetical protein [Austropuccinia psidii MF-1]